MKFALSQKFHFDAAHTLTRKIDAAGSKRIHGHTYHAEVEVTGTPDPITGMIVDLGNLRAAIASTREKLDHHFLDEVDKLGTPTLENLCLYLARQMDGLGFNLSRITVWREATGDRCSLDLS